MLRRKPLRAKGWTKPARRFPTAQAETPRVSFASAAAAAPVVSPKGDPVRSEAYRRLVAALPCWLCGLIGASQAAHADSGKAMAMKACDLTCYPACAPHDGLPGCHYIIGSTGTYTRGERRLLEAQAAEDTRAALVLLASTDRRAHRVLVAVGLLKGLA